jgi:polysaccharide biosynthesis transport protein
MQSHSSISQIPTLNGSAAVIPGLSNQPEGDFDPRKFLGMIRRRIVVVGVVAGLSMVFAINSLLNQTPAYRSGFRLLIEPVNADNNLSGLTGERSSGRSSLDYDTQIQVLRSPELLAKITEQVQALLPGFNPGRLQNLRIARVGETKLLEVSYQGSDPTEVRTVLEQASQVYLQYSLAERQTNLRQGIQFIERQLPLLQERVDALQDELQTFRQRYNFTDPDAQSSQVSSRTQELTSQLGDVEQQLRQARFRLSTLQSESGSLSALNNSGAYQSLVGQLRQIEVQVASELTRFQPQSLTIQVLEEKRQNLLPLLQQEAERTLDTTVAEVVIQIQALELQRQAILAAQSQVALQTQQLPILSRNYVDLQRELQIASDSLNRFRTTRETLQINAAQTEIPWQLIQTPGQPQIAGETDFNRSLLMGLLISTALGVGAAMGLEKLDSTFHTVDDLKAQTRLPVLGALPLYQPIQSSSTNSMQRWMRRFAKQFKRKKSRRRRLAGGSGLMLSRVPTSSGFMEALRVLYTNLRLLGSSTPLRSLVVTSALPEDGKSTVAFHLAQTARAMGQKVLLVETDLRRPQLHQSLNRPEQKGLSDVLAEQATLKEVIIQPHPEANFFTLTAGTIPTDPAQLLGSVKMQRLMAQFDQFFDLVIYDAPPLLGLADASLLAGHTSGILMVVRLNKTDKVAFNRALDSLKMSQMPVLGIVANGLEYQEFGFYGAYGDGFEQNLPGSDAAQLTGEVAPVNGSEQPENLEAS